jgi:hypothetical protein
MHLEILPLNRGNQIKMYVFPDLEYGTGNRFFQVAAALGYSEKYGHTIIFVKSCIKENTEHPGSEHILNYFPNIPIADISDYETIKQGGDNICSYEDLPYFRGNVKLKGLFQSDKYFPSYRIRPALLSFLEQPFSPKIFLHIRRGDYLTLNNGDLTEYYRNCLEFVRSKNKEPNLKILVCSDDIPWCKLNIPTLYSNLVSEEQWIWFEGTELETLRAMSKCQYGGICANSTFSWWGAYLNTSPDKFVFFPSRWNSNKLNFKDIYPKNSIVMSVEKKC